MSWFVHNMQTRRRAELIRKGQSPHRDAPPVYDREIASLAMGTRLETGPQPDLAALAMGVRQDDARTVARKAEPVEHVSAAIALDGVIGKERVMKAFNPPIRSDADATAHEHGKPPAPPASHQVSFTDLMAVIGKTIQDAVGATLANLQPGSLRLPDNAIPASVMKAAPDAVQRAIAENFAFLQKTAGTSGQRVTIIKSADGRDVPVVFARKAESRWDAAFSKLFGRAA
jgi:hypothetical protein